MNRYLAFGRIGFLFFVCFLISSNCLLANVPPSEPSSVSKKSILCDTIYRDTIQINTCEDYYRYNGNYYAVPGIFRITYKATDGCDSIIYLDLFCAIPIRKTIEACFGDTIQWFGTFIIANSSDYRTYQHLSETGDTLFELTLKAVQKTTLYHKRILCRGDTINFRNRVFDSAGYFEVEDSNFNYCDTTFFLEILDQDKIFQEWKTNHNHSSPANKIKFIDKSNGIGVPITIGFGIGYPYDTTVYLTTSEGRFWQTVYQDDSLEFSGLYIYDKDHYWITGKRTKERGLNNQGVLLVTSDGGQTWEKIKIPSPRINDIHFIDKDTFWIVCDVGYYGKTTDGGKTWTLTQNPNQYFLFSISINKTGFGLMLSEGDIIYRTFDYGKNWEEIPIEIENAAAGKIKVYDDFIVQIKDYFDIRYIHFAEIMVSNDYGITWENLKNRFPEHTIIQDALFTPDEEIIVVCNHGKVYYSNDKGNSFHGQQIETEADLLSISGDSLKYAAIVARDGKIFRPTFPLPTCDVQTSQPNQGDTLTVNEANLAWNYPTNCVEGFKVAYQVVSEGIVLKADTVDAGSLREVFLSELPYNSRVNYQILPYNANGLAESCDTFFFYTPACRAEAAQVDTTICQGDTLKIYGFALGAAGVYELNYRGENNCDSILPVQLRFKQNVLTSVSEIVQPGTVFNGVLIQSDTSFSEIYPAANGCDSIVSYFVKIVVGTHQVENESIILKIIPNPNRGAAKLEIAAARQADFTLKIFDLNGKIVWTKNGATARREKQMIDLDIENLAAGFYWIEFAQENIKRRLAMIKL